MFQSIRLMNRLVKIKINSIGRKNFPYKISPTDFMLYKTSGSTISCPPFNLANQSSTQRTENALTLLAGYADTLGSLSFNP